MNITEAESNAHFDAQARIAKELSAFKATLGYKLIVDMAHNEMADSFLSLIKDEAISAEKITQLRANLRAWTNVIAMIEEPIESHEQAQAFMEKTQTYQEKPGGFAMQRMMKAQDQMARY